MCYHPLKAFQIGYHDSGKPKYKITSYQIESVWNDRKSDLWYCSSEKLSNNTNYRTVSDFIEIPCGHCIDCRLKYSRDWANRCMLEAGYHDSNYFVTLTYDNDHLPDVNECIDPETGAFEDSPIHPLCKRDVQLFMKRLRKKYSDQKIRFYGCGEYGSINMRPHYHLILFGLKLDDLQPFFKNELNNQFFVSDSISQLWPYGFHSISQVTWETCAYTARYVTKKLSGEKAEIYERYNFPREFSLCSRKPGIAKMYYDDHVGEIYDQDKILIGTESKVICSKPPKYFDRLYDIDYPDESLALKEKRKEIAEANTKNKMSLTTLDYLSMLESKELNKLAQVKSLKRKDL